MKVHCVVPKGTVLNWNFPEGLPKSPTFHNAFMYTSVLQYGKVSVAVHMHVRVRSLKDLQSKLWNVDVIHRDDNELSLRLTPALPDAKATCQELRLWQYEQGRFVEFVPVHKTLAKLLLFPRRVVAEASKRIAC